MLISTTAIVHRRLLSARIYGKFRIIHRRKLWLATICLVPCLWAARLAGIFAVSRKQLLHPPVGPDSRDQIATGYPDSILGRDPSAKCRKISVVAQCCENGRLAAHTSFQS